MSTKSAFGKNKTEQRQLVVRCIQAWRRSDEARTFFRQVHHLVTTTVEGTGDDDGDQISKQPQVLQAAALTVRAHLDGLLLMQGDKKHKQRMSVVKVLSLLDEALEVAILLHDQLFHLQQLLEQQTADSMDDCDDEDHVHGHQVKVMQAAQAAILSLCEACWQAPVCHREQLVVQVLPLLLTQSLQNNNSSNSNTSGSQQLQQNSNNKSLMQRIWQLRDALQEIDFEHESSRYLRDILLKTTSHPLWLKLPEGRKFLSHLMATSQEDSGEDSDNSSSVKLEMHQAIRSQLPYASNNILQAYSEIYFRAWKHAADHQRKQHNDNDDNDSAHTPLSPQHWLEQYVLQDLVYSVVHVAMPGLRKSLHFLLETFYEAQKTPAVAALLYRMCSPILWRSLAAANPQVRCNALDLLARVFPLIDHDQRTSSNNNYNIKVAIDKALAALEVAMQDDIPAVRVAASRAMAHVLITYWDVVPTNGIRSLLNRVVTEHASDSTSALVRAGALDAITMLLQAPESHAVLRPLLPLVGNLIHDQASRVRLACVRMLLCVTKLPNIKFYHVVPVHHLTARLAAEQPGRVASALTQLLLPSYMPLQPSVSGTEKVQRTLTLLNSYPSAAAIFYAHLAKHVKVSAVAKLAVMLLQCLISAVTTDTAENIDDQVHQKRQRRCHQSRQSDNDELVLDGDSPANTTSCSSSTTNSSMLTAPNTTLMANIAETISALWASIKASLTKYPECYDFMIESFSGCALTDILRHFEEMAISGTSSETRNNCRRVCAALLHCAAQLPAQAVHGMVPHISSHLASMLPATENDHIRYQQQVTSNMALLCMWGYTDNVAESLTKSLISAFGDVDHPQVFNPRKRPSWRKNQVVTMVHKSSNDEAKINGDTTTLVLPPIAGSFAMSVLDDILRGSDPSSVAARRSLLNSAVASETLEKALECGVTCAERLLRGDTTYASYRHTSNVDLILKACELYGRYALHKEAAKGLELMELNQQAKTLLDWTTEKVVPAVMWPLTRLAGTGMEGQPSPFPELDLSRISIASSSAVVSEPRYPESPNSPERPRPKRPNRNSTPERVEVSFESSLLARTESRTGGALFLTESSLFTAHSAAVSLLQCSCMTFAEWLIVSRDDKGASQEITTAALKWCDMIIFKPPLPLLASSAQKGSSGAFPQDLWPGFWRLAVQLGKTVAKFDVLEYLIRNCDDSSTVATSDDDEHVLIQQAFVYLLSGRGDPEHAIVAGTVDTILKVASEQIPIQDESIDHLSPTAVSDVVDFANGGCIATALLAISASKQASLLLCERLVSMATIPSQKTPTAQLFATKCLAWFTNPESKMRFADLIKTKVKAMLADTVRIEGSVGHQLAEKLGVD